MVDINKTVKDLIVREQLIKLPNQIDQHFCVKNVKNNKYIIDQTYLSSYTPAKLWLIQNQQLKELDEYLNRLQSTKRERVDTKLH